MSTFFSLQNEARKLNHQEVVEEDKRLKLPANWEAKKARLEWELAEDQKKKASVECSFVYGQTYEQYCNVTPNVGISIIDGVYQRNLARAKINYCRNII